MTENFKVPSNDVSTICSPVEDAPESTVPNPVLTPAERVLSMSDDMKAMHDINPMEVYRLKNQLIVASDEPLEKKLDLLDQNQEKMVSNNGRASGILARLRSLKVGDYCKVAVGFLAGIAATTIVKDSFSGQNSDERSVDSAAGIETEAAYSS